MVMSKQMNKTLPPKKTVSAFRKTLVMILAVAVMLCLGYVVYYILLQGMNIAKTAADPLEKALISAGATKQCETGDGGHGPDNSQPWYQVTLSIERGEEDTVELVRQIANDNGYDLTHATVQNRGPVSVADIYLDKWYFDATSKKSDNTPIELTVAVNASGLNSVCKGKMLTTDASHTLVGVDVSIRRNVR
jgi:hypothetical protein